MGDEANVKGGYALDRTGKKPRKLQRGHYVFFVGLAMLVAGFLVLTRVNPQATNAPGTIAPLLILGAYVVIAIGILI